MITIYHRFWYLVSYPLRWSILFFSDYIHLSGLLKNGITVQKLNHILIYLLAKLSSLVFINAIKFVICLIWKFLKLEVKKYILNIFQASPVINYIYSRNYELNANLKRRKTDLRKGSVQYSREYSDARNK